MKRFSLIVSLAVCMLMFFGANAFAIWDYTIESKTVSQNQTDVDVSILGSWDLAVGGITVPVVVRTLSNNAFWTGTLPYDTGGTGFYHPFFYNVSWAFTSSIPGLPWTAQIEEWRPGVPSAPCDDQGDVGYEGVSPDHFVINAAGSGQGNPVEQGLAFCTWTFDVNGNDGQFEFDTACFTSSLYKLFLIDLAFPPVNHVFETSFNKGIITIEPNACPTSVESYGNVSGNVEVAMGNSPTGT